MTKSLARLNFLKSNAFLALTGTKFDSELINLLLSATASVNSYCNCVLYNENYTEYYTGAQTKYLYLENAPIKSIASVEFWDSSEDEWVTESSAYYEVRNGKYILYPILGQESNSTYGYWPSGIAGGIRITYTSGYPCNDWQTADIGEEWTVPADLEYAVCSIAHLAWMSGKGGGGKRGVTQVNVGGQGSTKEIFSAGSYPKDVVEILGKYRKLIV